MLIRGAEIWRAGGPPRQAGLHDVRVTAGRIAEIGQLAPRCGEPVLDARGGLLLPGLHDQHLHLNALAAARASVRCGPPDVIDEAGLTHALASPGQGWLRGIGYHESVAGLLDVATLDRLAPHRPVRIQHRSGRMWFLNSLALDILLANASPPPGLERSGGRCTGRLFDEDRWLRGALGGAPPSLAIVGGDLASFGVTGVTDMSPANDTAAAAHFASEHTLGRLPQTVVIAGTLALGELPLPTGLRLGPAKLHLHEAALPGIEASTRFVAVAHAQQRAVAVHCTTETELVFALAAIEDAGPRSGDRIEHVGIAPDHLVAEMARLGLQAVTQPHFIAERGDRYLRDVEPRDHPLLYRAAALRSAGIVLAAGSDAPFGSADPWAAMRSAVERRTVAGAVIGPGEALAPEEALSLYLRDPLDLASERRIAPGAPADLCLLDRGWSEARLRLVATDLQMTTIGGHIVHQRIDEAPVERGPGSDPPA